jgi:hypothetical protein
MTDTITIKTLEGRLIKIEQDVSNLEFQDKILEEKISGRLAIGEHTNVFLDVVFILLSFVLWAITMQGWKNSKDVEAERNQLRNLLEQDREEIKKYKNMLEEDREKFSEEYHKTIEDTFSKMNVNRGKIEENYREMQKKYEEIIKEIKGVSEYYLELVAVSHEPDLSERVFEYEKILKNAEKYHLSEEEKGRLYYYLSITLYQLATKTPDVKNKLVLEWIKKASKYISNAISLGGKKGIYYYEKAKIELEIYRLELINNKNFDKFAERIYEIEEYFEIAFKTADIEFYMFEEMILLLNSMVEKLPEKESDKRVIYDLISLWCERAKNFDEKSYKEDLEEIKLENATKIDEQNKKLDN